MTNEEREALIAQGWTPPVAVDPDIAKAKYIAQTARAERLTRTGDVYDLEKLALTAIKRGRALAAEAKPGMVWVKHDETDACPVEPEQSVCLLAASGNVIACKAAWAAWKAITHYAIITPPEDVA